MSITIGDKVNVMLDGNVEDGFIIGIRPFRGQQEDHTTVWIELTNYPGENKPNLQVPVRTQDLYDWTIDDLESWIAKTENNHSRYMRARNGSRS
jgi:hypothetical protein